MPHSDLHFNETIVFHDPRGLRDAYEDIGGDASLRDSRDIEMDQVFAFARAFRDGGEPALTLIPDEILQGSRSDWLPDMRISVNADYSQFADGIRRERDKGFAALSDVVAAWAEEKPPFHELLRRESQFGKHRRTALAAVMQRVANAGAGGDGMDLLYAALEPVWREFLMLRDFASRRGHHGLLTVQVIPPRARIDTAKRSPNLAVACDLNRAPLHLFGSLGGAGFCATDDFADAYFVTSGGGVSVGHLIPSCSR